MWRRLPDQTTQTNHRSTQCTFYSFWPFSPVPSGWPTVMPKRVLQSKQTTPCKDLPPIDTRTPAGRVLPF